MFKKNRKGQGALEYLLLIGGAVLIAVIVIALLVGMGGQSRDTASTQADKAQAALDVPQPAQIVSVVAKRSDCTPPGNTNIQFSWRPMGEGGSHALIIEDSSGTAMNIVGLTDNGGNPLTVSDIDPNAFSGLTATIDLAASDLCGNTYHMYIKTSKNNQTVTSSRYLFSWSN
ncbi:MAG: class III signal peptide-containing protein [archaeon]